MINEEVEKWTPISDYEDLYEISSLGNIRALPKEVIGRKGVIIKRKAKVLKPCIWGGYLMVVLCCNKIRTTIPLHRLVALNFIPNPESKPQINHKDGNKLNNKVGNLEWVTHQENMQHAFATELNRGRIGIENAKAKITEKEVIQIRELSAGGKNGNEIAAVFNLSTSTVNRIISRKYWKHVVAV
jgi:hypothetical protein